MDKKKIKYSGRINFKEWTIRERIEIALWAILGNIAILNNVELEKKTTK